MEGAGVYAIKNTVTGRVYVGSTENIAGRWAGHESMLRSGTHISRPIQTDLELHGPGSFELIVLEEIADPTREVLEKAEHRWIEHFIQRDAESLYNVRLDPRRHRARAVTSGGLIKTSFHLTTELLAEVDQAAQSQSLSRSAAMEILLRLGLKERTRLAKLAEAAA